VNLQPIREEDIVECDVRGRRFYALVAGKDRGLLRIRPIDRGVNHFTVRANQVINHFRRSKSGARPARKKLDGELEKD